MVGVSDAMIALKLWQRIPDIGTVFFCCSSVCVGIYFLCANKIRFEIFSFSDLSKKISMSKFID